MNIPVRRLCLIVACLLASAVTAAGLAWACVPTANVSAEPASGAGGLRITMTGDGFPPGTETVDIYLDSRANPPIKDDHPVTTTGTGNKAFSMQLTMPTALGAHLLIPVPRDAAGNDIGNTGTNGAGPPAAVFQVTDPNLTVRPASGPPGSRATVSGAAFKSGTVKLHWDSATGPELGAATATGAGFTFSRQITVPAGAVRDHTIVAVPFGDPSDSASASFRVTPPPPTPLPPPPAKVDDVGPAIVSASLTSGNRTRTVSRKGVVSLFCGSYAESGVTGECGAKSTRRLRVPKAARSAVLKLRAKTFQASAGKPVKVKFRLSRTSMRMLKKAKKVRMVGTVSARDAKGNPSPAVPFRFTLKAPRRK